MPLTAAAPAFRHTPGPWFWNGYHLVPARPDPTHYAVHTILDRSGGCGFLASKTADTLHELAADLALIEASPELAEALQQLRNAAAIALEGSCVLELADQVLARLGAPL